MLLTSRIGLALSFRLMKVKNVMQQLKSVILVHGATGEGSSWSKVIPFLRNCGLEVAAVQNPLTSLAGYVSSGRWALRALAGPALLVGHSWGGAATTEAENTGLKAAGTAVVATQH
jgi:pimeloyl-ACP methyl ester carboxylesterase